MYCDYFICSEYSFFQASQMANWRTFTQYFLRREYGIKHCFAIKKKSFTQNFEIFSKRAHITNVTNAWLPLITAKSVKQYQCNGPSGKRQPAELYYSGKDIQRQEEIIGWVEKEKAQRWTEAREENDGNKSVFQWK